MMQESQLSLLNNMGSIDSTPKTITGSQPKIADLLVFKVKFIQPQIQNRGYRKNLFLKKSEAKDLVGCPFVSSRKSGTHNIHFMKN
jgi:hypothetical protein